MHRFIQVTEAHSTFHKENMEHSDLRSFVLVASRSSWQNIRQSGCCFLPLYC